MFLDFTTPRTKLALQVLFWFLAATLFLTLDDRLPTGLTYMSSPSLPEGWYETHPIELPVFRGETVCAVYHQPKWAAGRHYLANGSFICKHIFGLPGDTIKVVHRKVTICQKGSTSCINGGIILTHDSKGRPVYSVHLPSIIPPGYVYLGSTLVPNSFDSRYLGLFPISDLRLRIKKL